jgi:hypothetical protein
LSSNTRVTTIYEGYTLLYGKEHNRYLLVKGEEGKKISSMATRYQFLTHVLMAVGRLQRSDLAVKRNSECHSSPAQLLQLRDNVVKMLRDANKSVCY